VTTLAEANAILEAQRAFFDEDAEIEREAAIWRDATPEERFAAMIALCGEADYFLSLLTPDKLERVLRTDLPSDFVPLLPPETKAPCGD
jgi:hypothetical protein